MITYVRKRRLPGGKERGEERERRAAEGGGRMMIGGETWTSGSGSGMKNTRGLGRWQEKNRRKATTTTGDDHNDDNQFILATSNAEYDVTSTTSS